MKRAVPIFFAVAFASIPAFSYVIWEVLEKDLWGPRKLVLGLAEVAGWFWHGDNGSRRMLVATGLPVAIAAYGGIGWGLGWIALRVFALMKLPHRPGIDRDR